MNRFGSISSLQDEVLQIQPAFKELFDKFKFIFDKKTYNLLVVDDTPFNIEVI